MTIYFLACPYSHKDKNIVINRFNECTKVAARIFQSGRPVYSQITMSHPVNESIRHNHLGKVVDWAPIDMKFMEKCDEIIILEMDGWKESSGVQREIEYFRNKGAKVWLFSEFEKEFL